MIDAVNGLIFNTLIAERAIKLPNIGTLYIERSAATTDGKRVVSPRYAVNFSSHVDTVSIVDIIARTASVDVTTANDIFERWEAKCREGNTLHINGVGTLRDKTFITDDELVKSLNGNQIDSLTLTRKRGSATWWIAAIVAVVAVGLAGAYLYYPDVLCSADTTHYVEAVANIEEVAVNEVIVTEDNIEEEITVIEEPEVVEVPAVKDWTSANDIRHRVIVGSYSTKENAQRAIRDIERRLPELKCSIYMLGSMHAVAIYGSADNADCEAFMSKYGADFTQMWIHTPKRYR